jgi:hypothetical protein
MRNPLARIFAKKGGITAGAAVTASIRVAAHMWVHWAHVSIGAAKEARAAREEIIEAHRAGGPVPIDKELRPSIVAVTASAHALDALYAELKPLVVPESVSETWQRKRPVRRNQIHETFQLAFRISAQEWRSEFAWLFGLRDDAVHPSFAFEVPTPTHLEELHAAREYSVFTTDAADRAVAILIEVISVGVERPKKAAEEWANGSVETVRAIVAEQAESS